MRASALVIALVALIVTLADATYVGNVPIMRRTEARLGAASDLVGASSQSDARGGRSLSRRIRSALAANRERNREFEQLDLDPLTLTLVPRQ
jgi:hypothetical protein